MRNPLQLRVGLALGGGAARGMAHLGVLRVLQEASVPIDVIVGTSMGAILGGAWAAERDVDALEQRVRAVLTSEQFRKNRLNFLKETKKERGGLLFSVCDEVYWEGFPTAEDPYTNPVANWANTKYMFVKIRPKS